ncbi:hypothetical protein Slala03_74230 [Streptomyces lavendulae subsp. lavendulae]|nr:hypothetical protein Slala03_74230 [Streptomyces lavendulae subsp. lavendulae]
MRQWVTEEARQVPPPYVESHRCASSAQLRQILTAAPAAAVVCGAGVGRNVEPAGDGGGVGADSEGLVQEGAAVQVLQK